MSRAILHCNHNDVLCELRMDVLSLSEITTSLMLSLQTSSPGFEVKCPLTFLSRCVAEFSESILKLHDADVTESVLRSADEESFLKFAKLDSGRRYFVSGIVRYLTFPTESAGGGHPHSPSAIVSVDAGISFSMSSLSITEESYCRFADEFNAIVANNVLPLIEDNGR